MGLLRGLRGLVSCVQQARVLSFLLFHPLRLVSLGRLNPRSAVYTESAP